MANRNKLVCNEFRAAWSDKPIAELAALISIHLSKCSDCMQWAKEMELFVVELHQLEPYTLPDEFECTLIKNLRVAANCGQAFQPKSSFFSTIQFRFAFSAVLLASVLACIYVGITLLRPPVKPLPSVHAFALTIDIFFPSNVDAVDVSIYLPDGISLAFNDATFSKVRSLKWREVRNLEFAQRKVGLFALRPGSWQMRIQAMTGLEKVELMVPIQVSEQALLIKPSTVALDPSNPTSRLIRLASRQNKYTGWPDGLL